MPKTKRRPARQATPAPANKPKGLKHHPAVWLATLSTVVGVATGMFTLRDQVLPREAGTAVAVPMSVYEQRVGDICDETNDNDRARARADRTIRKQLKTAKTTTAQRNALLDGVRQTIARSGHALAAFTALETPKALAVTRDHTQAAWNRNLARLRDYALRLDRSATRSQLLATLDHLATMRPLLASDGVTLTSGLERLGRANCDLRPPIVTATFTLPPLPTHRHTHSPGHTTSANTPGGGASAPNRDSGGGAAGSGSTSANTPGAGGGGSTSANTPGAGGGGSTSANTPGATGGGSSGGGGGGGD
jgi:hypothetical protein